MSDLTKDAIEVILKHLTDRLALALLFLSALLLAAMAIQGEVGDWSRGHKTWIAFALLGSVCYLPTRLVLERASEWQTSQKRKKRLHNLTPREKQLLAPYVHNDFRTRRIPHTDPVAKGLADDGVLYRPDVPRDDSGHEAYNIQDWARMYFKKHKDLVAAPDNISRTAQGDL
jgi:hypothetical protein